MQTHSPPPGWFNAAILRGLGRLLSLSLDRTPAAELLGDTASTWADALWPGKAWHESDASRIEEAFRRVSATFVRWPAPAELLAHLPAREPPTHLMLPPRVETPAERERGMKHIAELLDRLNLPEGEPQ